MAVQTDPADASPRAARHSAEPAQPALDAGLASDAAPEPDAEPAEDSVLSGGAMGEGPAFAGADRFLDDPPDESVRQLLLHDRIQRVERGRGGRSLGFKITLAGGKKAYFKPEQTFSAANWFGEVAAYHLDRMLGLGRVPCVASREFEWSDLAQAAGKDKRVPEIIQHDGKVRGAFVAWVSGELRALKQAPGWERWIRVRYWPSTAVTPYQRPAAWKWQLDQVRKHGDDWRSKEERLRRRNLHPVPDREDRPAELSDLIVFDYLTRNLDRWGGNNANVLVRGPHGPLVFLDNGAGFENGDQRPSLMEARLHALQRFRRSTIAAIQAFDIKGFEARLGRELVQPVLGPQQIEGLAARRVALLEWVEEVRKVHGEAIWAWE